MVDRIHVIENYARTAMATSRVPELMLGHEYDHVDRVRQWALRIAEGEAFPDRDQVQAAALLHDIGLAVVEQRRQHAQVGGEQAATFLRQHDLFVPQEIDAIAEAIRYHSSLTGGGVLGAILRDADMLDLFGAAGIMRAFTAQYATPKYPENAVKGDTWGFSADDFTARFQAGRGAGAYAVDYLNFHLSCVDNLQTVTAKRLAEPLVAYMKAFLVQLEVEVLQGRS